MSLVLTGPARAELIGWWTFDEGSGSTAFDLSGLGNDGTLEGDPQWVDGVNAGGLELERIMALPLREDLARLREIEETEFAGAKQALADQIEDAFEHLVAAAKEKK